MSTIKIFLSAEQDRKIAAIIQEKSFRIESASGSIEQSASKIETCDALVFEYAGDIVDVLFLIIKGVELKKPILVLIPEDNAKELNPFFKTLNKKIVEIKKYSKDNLQSQVERYLSELSEKLGMQRYNVVLGNKHKKYLDWASNVHGRSRSEIIRYSLDYLISADQEYKS